VDALLDEGVGERATMWEKAQERQVKLECHARVSWVEILALA
jgi:hypothetical protein